MGADDRLDLSPAGQLLVSEVKAVRSELKEVAHELKTVAMSLAQLTAQDWGRRLSKIEDVEISAMRARIERVEQFQVKVVTTISVIGTILILLNAMIGWFVAFKR